MRGKAFTAKGTATRLRIIETAADLVAAKGVAGATLDEILAQSAASKSQFYHYFADKDALIGEVIRLQTRRVFEAQAPQLTSFGSMAELRLWRDAVVELAATRKHSGGCPLGALAYQLSAGPKPARLNLQASFDDWTSFFEQGLARMKASGQLKSSANCAELAKGLLASLQGGLLLSMTEGDVRPLAVALHMALDHIAAQVVRKRGH